MKCLIDSYYCLQMTIHCSHHIIATNDQHLLNCACACYILIRNRSIAGQKCYRNETLLRWVRFLIQLQNIWQLERTAGTYQLTEGWPWSKTDLLNYLSKTVHISGIEQTNQERARLMSLKRLTSLIPDVDWTTSSMSQLISVFYIAIILINSSVVLSTSYYIYNLLLSSSNKQATNLIHIDINQHTYPVQKTWKIKASSASVAT